MDVRYYSDPRSGLPHILTHDVKGSEVEDVLMNPGEDRSGHEGARVAIGRTRDGRYVRVVYVPDAKRDSMFVITACEVGGEALAAYKRRCRKKGKR